MTFLYDARYLVVLPRQKNEVKLLTQSAPNQIWLGNGLYQIRGIIFNPLSSSVLYRSFPPNADGSVVLGKLTTVHTGRVGGGKNK